MQRLASANALQAASTGGRLAGAASLPVGVAGCPWQGNVPVIDIMHGMSPLQGQ